LLLFTTDFGKTKRDTFYTKKTPHCLFFTQGRILAPANFMLGVTLQWWKYSWSLHAQFYFMKWMFTNFTLSTVFLYFYINQKTKVSQESVSNSWKYKTPQLPIVCPWHTFLCESLQFLGQILSWVHNIILWNFTYVLKLAWQIKQLHVGFFVVWMKIWKSQTVVLRSIGKLLAYNYFLCCQKRSKVVFKCKKSTQTEECVKNFQYVIKVWLYAQVANCSILCRSISFYGWRKTKVDRNIITKK